MSIQTNELASVITEHIVKEVPDGLSKHTAFCNWVFGDGKKRQKGGLLIQFPVKLMSNDSKGFISGTNSTLDINPNSQLQYGQLNWKYHYTNVNFTLADFNIAQGEEQAVDFMEAKISGAKADTIRDISSKLHGTSTSNALYLEGLKDVVAASGTAYAGLTDTDYTDDTTAYLPYIATDTVVNYQNINKLVTKCRARVQGTGLTLANKRMMGLMNEATFSRFMTSVQNSQIFSSDLQVKTGFTGFAVNNVEFYLDADCPGTQDGSTGDNYVYVFPVEVMKFYYNYGFGSSSPFDGEARGPQQAIMSTQSFITGNLVCNNRRLVSVNKVLVA